MTTTTHFDSSHVSNISKRVDKHMNDATTRFHLEYLKGFVALLCDGNSYLKGGEKRNINF